MSIMLSHVWPIVNINFQKNNNWLTMKCKHDIIKMKSI